MPQATIYNLITVPDEPEPGAQTPVMRSQLSRLHFGEHVMLLPDPLASKHGGHSHVCSGICEMSSPCAAARCADDKRRSAFCGAEHHMLAAVRLSATVPAMRICSHGKN